MPRHPADMPARPAARAPSASDRPGERAVMFAARPRLSARGPQLHSRPMNKFVERAIITAIAGVQAVALGGCAWLSLSWGAFSYPTTQDGDAANVALHGDWAYVTRGAVGIELLRAGRNPHSRVIGLPPGLESVDDVAVADVLLFALDSLTPGNDAVSYLVDPSAPVPVREPLEVPVCPCSGVTTAAGRVIVSGFTSSLIRLSFDALGHLGEV